MRNVNKCFDEIYKGTTGVDFALKSIEWDVRTVVRLQLWDIAGECQNYNANVRQNQILWHLLETL